MPEENETKSNDVELATELAIAWLSNPNTRASAEEAIDFLKSAHAAVGTLSGGAPVPAIGDADVSADTVHEPAVTVRKSLGSRDHIISMIDGKPYKTLRRHLSTHGLTPEEYRARYGLKPDYPMVAPAYSEQRRAMAKKIGLGRKPGETRAAKPAAAATAQPDAAKPKRGRKPAAPRVATA